MNRRLYAVTDHSADSSTAVPDATTTKQHERDAGLEPNTFDWLDLAFDFSCRRGASQLSSAPDRYGQDWYVTFGLTDDQGEVVSEVGHASIVLVDWIGAAAAGCTGFDVMDDHSGDLATIGSIIFDGTELDPVVEDALQLPVGRALILDQVWIDPRFRGQNLGPKCAAVVLLELRTTAGFAACYPAPFENMTGTEDTSEAVRRLGQIWSQVGFEPVGGGVWLLDFATTDLDRAAERLGVLGS